MTGFDGQWNGSRKAGAEDEAEERSRSRDGCVRANGVVGVAELGSKADGDPDDSCDACDSMMGP